MAGAATHAAYTGTSLDRKRPRQPDHNAAQAYYHVLVRPASSQYLFGPEWQGAHAILHCTDDGVRLLRHAALALCLAPRLVREMRPVLAEGGQAGLRRNRHNDRVTKIAVIACKLAEFKVKTEIRLTIENRLANPNQTITT